MFVASFIALGAALAVPLIQADAATGTEHPALPPFHAIVIDGAAHLAFTEAPAQSVTVTATPAMLRRVTLTVRNGVLHVDQTHGTRFGGDGRLALAVTAPALDRIDVTGAVRGVARGLTGPSFTLNLSGAGSMTVTGTVARAALAISGAGGIDAGSLRAKHLTADLSGAGSLRAYASDSCRVSVSGVGTAVIAGNPRNRTIDRSGVGSVTFD